MRRRNNSPVFITNSYNLLGMQLELAPAKSMIPVFHMVTWDVPRGMQGYTTVDQILIITCSLFR